MRGKGEGSLGERKVGAPRQAGVSERVMAWSEVVPGRGIGLGSGPSSGWPGRGRSSATGRTASWGSDPLRAALRSGGSRGTATRGLERAERHRGLVEDVGFVHRAARRRVTRGAPVARPWRDRVAAPGVPTSPLAVRLEGSKVECCDVVGGAASVRTAATACVRGPSPCRGDASARHGAGPSLMFRAIRRARAQTNESL